MQLSYSAVSRLLGEEGCTDPSLVKLMTSFPEQPQHIQFAVLVSACSGIWSVRLCWMGGIEVNAILRPINWAEQQHTAVMSCLRRAGPSRQEVPREPLWQKVTDCWPVVQRGLCGNSPQCSRALQLSPACEPGHFCLILVLAMTARQWLCSGRCSFQVV